MVKEIVKDAVHIKLKVREESPLISVYEYCYAAGYALKKINATPDEIENIRSLSEFNRWKEQMNLLIKKAQADGKLSEDDRLASLIMGCRVRGELSEDAYELFAMGLK